MSGRLLIGAAAGAAAGVPAGYASGTAWAMALAEHVPGLPASAAVTAGRCAVILLLALVGAGLAALAGRSTPP